jgi:hypothetical protein
MLDVKPEEGPAKSVKPGQLFEIKWDYHIVGTMA